MARLSLLSVAVHINPSKSFGSITRLGDPQKIGRRSGSLQTSSSRDCKSSGNLKLLWV